MKKITASSSGETMNFFRAKASVILIPLLLLASSGITKAQSVTQQEADSYLKNLPFPMGQLKVPLFPEKYFHITKFGAVGDGQTKNTRAIQEAIDECSKGGGGYVIVPSGFWLTGPISFKSNVNLHLEKGAMLVFSADHNDFPLIKVSGKSGYVCANPILGEGVENIAITGDGIINGNGHTWRPVKKSKQTSSEWKDLLKSGGELNEKGDIWWPSSSAAQAEKFLAGRSAKELTLEDYQKIKDFYRPHMVYLINCKNVLLDGPTFQNSPNFALYVSKSENIIVGYVKVNNEWFAQNGDGLDFSSCKNVLVYKCTVNAGDDGICVKSSPSGKGTEPQLQNVVIADCVVYHAHGGFVAGSNTDGGIKNVYVNNCNFSWTDTGLRFKSGKGRGGVVEDVFISNIFMKDIKEHAIIFDMYYEDKGVAKTKDKPNQNKTPLFQKIHIDKLVCEGVEQAVYINDLPEAAVRDIDISNTVIVSRKGFESIESENLKLNNVTIRCAESPVFSLTNSRNILLNGISYDKNTWQFIKLSGSKVKNIEVINTKIGTAGKPVEFGEGADTGALKIN